MKMVKVIYFNDCPNAQNMMNVLSELGIEFEKIEQTSLLEGDEFKNYSSPTVIASGVVIFGSKAEGGGCSLNIPSIDYFREELLN
ncbi:glutathione S-transferase N-terminal domain-containing protein [Halobacteriovorax sp.]|uniref:glutathione S-transferase N-terminal domain-containing protein n=1 Tax=Halobacteriovorax sp. TaxID=2020862 RepID=UPI003AF20794